MIPNWRESFADELLVGERAVHFRGVEEGDAGVDRGADDRDAVFTGEGAADGWS